MQDKRVTKTKRNLKKTMIGMLGDMPFEKITVSELCRIGETSRITFYTHYDDKYDLIEEIFDDYVKEAVDDYYHLQEQNNPNRLALFGYYNMLDCILNLYSRNRTIFAMISSERNPYLYSAFYQHIFRSVYDYITRHSKQMRPKYPPRQMAALICNGLWGVITECCTHEGDFEAVRGDIMAMFNDILQSDIFSILERK